MPRLFSWLVQIASILSVAFFPTCSAVAAANDFTPEQRKEIVEIVRNALKSDPSILRDAIASLRAAVQKQAAVETAKPNTSAPSTWKDTPSYEIRGNLNGKVTVVEFLDPRCSYCRSMVALVDRLLSKDHDIRFIEKIVPVLSEKSVIDTQAIFAAALQGGYAPMKAALMNDRQSPTLAHIKEVARKLHLDGDRLLKDMNSTTVSDLIRDNLTQARKINLSGTPTFIFGNNTVVPGALSYDELVSHVKQAAASSR